VSEGAHEAASPAELAAQVDVIFTNLPDSPDVETVALGEAGILEGARQGLIYVDNSTIKPATARHIAAEMEKKGVLCLDAPVSGGDIGARDGTLAIMVGGPEQALERVRPVFQAMGKTITHVGSEGAGQIAKAANQIMVAAQMVALGELLIFAQKAGADPEKVVEAIRGGAAQCWTLDVKPRAYSQAIAIRVSKPLCRPKIWGLCSTRPGNMVFRCLQPQCTRNYSTPCSRWVWLNWIIRHW
jgi:2-hydroxy-3-oxopropionate reductase